MANIILNVDDELKRECELLFNEMGLDINEAVILFLEASVKNNDIPFSYQLNNNNLSKVSDALIKKYGSRLVSFIFQKKFFL